MQDKYLITDEWKIIERGFDAENAYKSEAIFSIGNGHMGQRANFEEDYSGLSLQGSYVAGVYYPDKTKVGWWKNGYPEYFAKVINSVNWIGIRLVLDGESVDLAKSEVLHFERTLDMQKGLLQRKFRLRTTYGKELEIVSERFVSMHRREIGAIAYSVSALNFSGEMEISPYLDFDVQNEDSNWEEKFWEEVDVKVASQKGTITARTKKLGFVISTSMRYELFQDSIPRTLYPDSSIAYNQLSNSFKIELEQGSTYTLYKYVSILSSLNHKVSELGVKADEAASLARRAGYEKLRVEHVDAWRQKWETSDIIIEGDEEAQQGIRFNIFHLHQTYTGDDPRLNIGPKGFTGEKYGGSTYWDTEAYCLPFYLATSDPKVGRQLLVYRYQQLEKAIENAAKLGFTGGAALYPMVTMNGEECHNEWEITFEEIHRNGAIAFAVFDYIRHTDDHTYLEQFGLEVLIAISRFWAQRVNWSNAKNAYVMLGVTGPNEYENNVNNNWYTNLMAHWTLRYTHQSIAEVKERDPEAWNKIKERITFHETRELEHWDDIVKKLYFPMHPDKGVFLQQDGFLDKEIMAADELDPKERPINQHWSWDRILRSCFIKQADVLQGMFFLGHEFDSETTRRNFDYYEPMTVHESSLSPSVHAILAARLGYLKKAVEMYLRTSRLDLDDYNREVHEGLHITSMAGTWMSVVHGFGGMKILDETLHFDPILPDQWEKLKFRIIWRMVPLIVSIGRNQIHLYNEGDKSTFFFVAGKRVDIEAGHDIFIKRG
jgi:maltose phosphorylase